LDAGKIHVHANVLGGFQYMIFQDDHRQVPVRVFKIKWPLQSLEGYWKDF
jgi:hypothetical protein